MLVNSLKYSQLQIILYFLFAHIFVTQAEVYTPIPGVWSGSIPASTAGLVPLQTPLVGTGTNPAVPTGTGLLTKQQSTCK